ncbi:MAG: hypothetical protein IIB22_03135 [Chloroflexi bacterium]|nr:hypothetical protein [Chloroflexota bacterium]
MKRAGTNVESKVVGRIKVTDKVPPGTQAATRYVNKDIVWPKALTDHEVDLYFSDLLPDAANIASVGIEARLQKAPQPAVLIERSGTSWDCVDYVDQVAAHVRSRSLRRSY